MTKPKPEEMLKLLLVQQLSVTEAQAELIWLAFESFCQRRLREDYPDSGYAAIVLDGEGGEIIGVDLYDDREGAD